MIITTYNPHVGSFFPSLGLRTTKVYSGDRADFLMKPDRKVWVGIGNNGEPRRWRHLGNLPKHIFRIKWDSVFFQKSLEFLLVAHLAVMSFPVGNFIPCSFIHFPEFDFTTEMALASASTGGKWMSRW